MNQFKQRVLGEMLERSLRSPLPVLLVNRRTYLLGQGARDEVITSCRFILVLKGQLNYSIEGREYSFGEGAHFLIPSWCRRSWAAVGHGCEIIWCEFDDDPKEIHTGGCFFRHVIGAEFESIQKDYSEMLCAWDRREPAAEALRRLELEGQLKGLLSRFVPRVESDPSIVMNEGRRLHPEIKNALQWLETNYTKATVLEELQSRSGITPNYFRLRFKEAVLCSPSDYVKQLRLRYARYLLHQTDWQQKRIAADVGYSDPLYFSRIYRQFWGKSPSEERLSQRVS
ncbi:AraC family transcriptional regulator [Coraliomargarita sp. SDUM461003]|uniref:AraC family transcriptional regulator n=1 Tax=Thalassobacterium maritimum TaxID=3041265 RepID=A0ABU1B042_9BACT|nr:AraC family transcriptional regulator [Coraliomargarita sp. SDUM461003]MDQ8208869.1 AraC family transcriptional regulator [Coraliomargarita sp. SDUM461003]